MSDETPTDADRDAVTRRGEMLMDAMSRNDRAIYARVQKARWQNLPSRQPEPPAAAPAMIGVGTWRLYFNRHGAAGLPWCVAPDAGGWELAVAGVDVRVPSATVYAPKATPDDEDGRPSAWITCAGRLTITAGVATIATP